MPEELRPLKVFEVTYVCDACGKGTMQTDHRAASPDSLSYLHKCDHCGAQKYLDKRYPQVVYHGWPTK